MRIPGIKFYDRYKEWKKDCERCPDNPKKGIARVRYKRNAYMEVAYFPRSLTWSIAVVLRQDNCPVALIKGKTEDGREWRRFHEDCEERFQKWAKTEGDKIKDFAAGISGLWLTADWTGPGTRKLEFSSLPAPLSIAAYLFLTKEQAWDYYYLIEEFIEKNVNIWTTESRFDLEWVSPMYFDWSKPKISRKTGWELKGYETPRPVTEAMFYRDMAKGIAIFLGFVTGFWGLMVKKVFAEVLGTPTISEKYQYDIEIENLLMPARPVELKFQANLWDKYYSKEFSQRVYIYWHIEKKTLPEAARLAAKDVQDILNKVDKQYEVKWRISDQILGTKVANGEAVVRVRPLIFDMKFKSTPYPIDGFEIKQGIVPNTLYHLVWVVGGEKGYWQTVEAPSVTCSDPFGGNCETGCLVGCEASCEANPCMHSCQTGCQTSCEVSCQTCTNDALLCGYSLSCNCTNSGNGRVTVSGKTCYDSQTGCKGLSGQNLSIYQASWGTTYTASTDSNGDYSLNAPKPLGSDPIYVNWTDPQGKEHTCSTSDCTGCSSNADCPSGYVCENGKCVQSISGNPELTGVSFDTTGFCNGVFGLSGKFLSGIGGGTRGKITVLVNQEEAKCAITPGSGIFNLTVAGYPVAKGNNSISVTGEECPSGTCSGGCNGPLATTIRKTITCFCRYSISCSVDKNSVAAGGSVTFSGTLASTNEKECPTVVQSVWIYVDGSSEGTIPTGFGNFSMPVTLKTAGKHVIEAKFGNASCSKTVTVTPAPVPVNISMKWSETAVFFKNSLTVSIDSTQVDISSLYPGELSALSVEKVVCNWSLQQVPAWKKRLKKELLLALTAYTQPQQKKIRDAVEELWLELACFKERGLICNACGKCCDATPSTYGWTCSGTISQTCTKSVKITV